MFVEYRFFNKQKCIFIFDHMEKKTTIFSNKKYVKLAVTEYTI